MFLYPTLFFLLSCILFLVLSSPRIFSVIWLSFHPDNHHHPVSPLSGTSFKYTSDPLFLLMTGSCTTTGGSPLPLLSITDLQWLQLYLLCLCFQTAAACMEWSLDHARTSENKTQHSMTTVSSPLITESNNNIGRKEPLEVTQFNNPCSEQFRLLRTLFSQIEIPWTPNSLFQCPLLSVRKHFSQYLIRISLDTTCVQIQLAHLHMQKKGRGGRGSYSQRREFLFRHCPISLAKGNV